jgi:FMN phosphatase YigB (HAD superfamily)
VSLPAIRTVTLDWGDTLATNHGQPYGFVHRRGLARLAAQLHALGGRVPDGWRESLLTEWDAHWERVIDRARNPEHQEFDQLGLFQRHIAGTGLDPLAPAVAAALEEFSAGCLETVLAYDGVGPVLAELKRRGYRLGILSHVAWHRTAVEAWFARRGWHALLDFWSLSSEVGWIKPHPAHFQHALAQAGCAPEAVLHVGDHPLRDVEGGRAHGVVTCLRRTEGIYPAVQLDACAPDCTVVHVRELLELLPGVR